MSTVVADLFPLTFSIVTLVVLLSLVLVDLAIYESVIIRPAFELAWLGVLSFLSLGQPDSSSTITFLTC